MCVWNVIESAGEKYARQNFTSEVVSFFAVFNANQFESQRVLVKGFHVFAYQWLLYHMAAN